MQPFALMLIELVHIMMLKTKETTESVFNTKTGNPTMAVF